MHARLAWLAGGLAVAGAVLYRALSGRARLPETEPGPDPRAEALRRKLAESRSVVAERDEFESAETPVDQVDSPPPDVDERRRTVHEEGRAAARRMRTKPSDD
jgi:hypothetical protein